MLPRCPGCGRPLTMNLRSDDRFVEDEGWRKAAVEYEVWLTAHRNKRVLFLEIGVYAAAFPIYPPPAFSGRQMGRIYGIVRERETKKTDRGGSER